jgi:hypothetical protein
MSSSENPNQLDDRTRSILDAAVFVVGAPRSGTTWLQRMLVSLPEVVGGAETNFFLIFGRGLREIRKAQRGQRGAGMFNYWSPPGLVAEFSNLWRRTMAPMLQTKPGATILSEKTPSHALFMPEIIEIVPGAKFVHIIRDSRAVAASLLAAHETWGHDWAPSTARHAAGWWYNHVDSARSAGRTLGPARYHEVFYEDLRADPARHLRAVLDFVSLHPTDEALRTITSEQSFDRQREVAGTPFVHERATGKSEPTGFFRRGLVDGWKDDLTIRQKLVVWRHTRHLMRECGYSWRGRACATPAPNPPEK